FGIVRNPYERFLSLYNYARMEISYYHNNINPKATPYGRHLDYDLLKNASLKECAKYLEDGKLQHDRAWNHWFPQYTWLYNESGTASLVSNIYKLENLPVLVKDLNNMGIAISDFPKINSSSKIKDGRNLLDSATEKIIENY